MSEYEKQMMLPVDLQQATGFKRHSKQIAWFKECYGVDVVTRSDGSVVMTWAAFSALTNKRLGVDASLTPKKRVLLASEEKALQAQLGDH